MGFDKAEIIASTLRTQAAKHAETAKAARKELIENEGAASALHQLALQMPSFAAEIEKRIEKDEEMSSETAQQVRVYSRNIIARFQTMCTDNERKMKNDKLLCEGRAQANEQSALTLMKDADTEIAFATNREKMNAEVDAEQEKNDKEKTRLAKIATAAKKSSKSKSSAKRSAALAQTKKPKKKEPRKNN
jgi:hypothetical protein